MCIFKYIIYLNTIYIGLILFILYLLASIKTKYTENLLCNKKQRKHS